MRSRPFREARTSWLLALGLPVPAGAVMWLVMTVATSHHACVTGAGKSGGEVIALLALVVVPVAVVAGHAWRARTELAYVVSPLFVALLFGAALQFVVISAWWSGHGCAT